MSKNKDKTDSRERGWIVTLPANTYDKEQVEEGLKNYSYLGQLERGTGLTEASPEGYLHWQIYIENDECIRFSTLKNKFPKGHFEVRKGTKQQAFDYVSKSDSAQGVVIYNGQMNLEESNPGRRSDLERFADLVKDGVRVIDLVRSDSRAVRYVRMLEDLQQKEDAVRNAELGWRPVKVTYLSGPTRVGKSSGVIGSYERGSVFRVTDYAHPFDGYSGQKVLILDEFSGQIPFSQMLNVLDGLVTELSARYNNKWAAYDTVWVISNQRLQHQYREVRSDPTLDWSAFEARFHSVKHMADSETVLDISEEYKVREFLTEYREVPKNVQRDLLK